MNGRDRGALAIVLHTHMPYVEGFGTWPFGEEWLWEAIACCYLPLLDLLSSDAPLSLSLTPVLCDQLEVADVPARFATFIAEVRRATHAEDAHGLRAGGHERLAGELERAWSDYERAGARMNELGGDLLGALAPYASWTSAATHAVLPLMASDAGVRLQLRAGVHAHRRRFGERWGGGLWLPECGFASWLTGLLADAGVRATCVELTNQLGVGAAGHLRPLLDAAGVVLVPIDRATISLVWSEHGYPAAGPYRDYHHHTVHHHNPWSNSGDAYDHEAAIALTRVHAADFVSRTLERLRAARERASSSLPGGGLVVCALDTELLGHWWYEGVAWLQAVVDECARQGLALVRIDDALERADPAPADGHAGGCAEGSWGAHGDLSTWSGPAVAEMAFTARAAELSVLAAGERAGEAAVRELLALQASDWAFMVSREVAVPYARERFEHHRAALVRALADRDVLPGALRNLAVNADPALLREP